MGFFVEMVNIELEYICMLYYLYYYFIICYRLFVQLVISVNGREDYLLLSEIYDYNGLN